MRFSEKVGIRGCRQTRELALPPREPLIDVPVALDDRQLPSAVHGEELLRRLHLLRQDGRRLHELVGLTDVTGQKNGPEHARLLFGKHFVLREAGGRRLDAPRLESAQDVVKDRDCRFRGRDLPTEPHEQAIDGLERSGKDAHLHILVAPLLGRALEQSRAVAYRRILLRTQELDMACDHVHGGANCWKVRQAVAQRRGRESTGYFTHRRR
mmetsp:Transcript_125162/g.362116  ORF Transcript_125162/g.362116 Transcript_125162/m.362116 type:complete len:211 (-) Transcript_125162:475-1107(-)